MSASSWARRDRGVPAAGGWRRRAPPLRPGSPVPTGWRSDATSTRRVVETAEHGGYPLLDHLRKILDGPIVWAPGVDGAVVLSLRGDDFVLDKRAGPVDRLRLTTTARRCTCISRRASASTSRRPRPRWHWRRERGVRSRAHPDDVSAIRPRTWNSDAMSRCSKPSFDASPRTLSAVAAEGSSTCCSRPVAQGEADVLVHHAHVEPHLVGTTSTSGTRALSIGEPIAAPAITSAARWARPRRARRAAAPPRTRSSAPRG